MSELTFKQAIKKLRKVSFAGNLSKAGKNTIASLAALILLPAAFAHAAIVSKDGNYDYTSIRAALNDPATAGETIIVKPDIYEESNLTVGGNRTLQAENPNSPESTIIDANDTNEPVISGAANATIIGFTIRGGKTDAPGAGIRPSGGSVVLQNLIIEKNVSSYAGGGIGSNTGGVTVTIINCTIRDNRAPIGGGAWMLGNPVKITDSEIENNVAFGNSSGMASGGGIYVGTYSYLEIENTTITGNSLTGSNRSEGAGIFAQCTTQLSNVTVSNNIANDGQYGSNGGGICTNRTLYLEGGEISNNQAYRGGGVCLSSSASFTSSAVISGNTAREGIIGSGGGIYCSYPDNLQITSGAVSGNAPDDIGCIPSGQLPSGPTPNSCANDDASGTDADPINTFTGELFGQFSPDIDLGGPMPLFFARYYASGLLNANITGSLGNNWSHNFEWTLTHIGTHIHLVDNQGRLIQFSQNGSAWDLIGKTDIVYQLAETTGTFTLFDPRSERLYTFNANGQLTTIADGKGNIHSLDYDGSGLLTQVADGLGRTLNFAYDSNDLLIGVGDSARTIIFSYTADGLTGVTDALGNLTIYTYASDGLMTSSTRPEGNSPFTQTYDSNNKVDSQSDANGNTYTFDYTVPDTTVTDPLGNTRVHTHTATGELGSTQDQADQSVAIGSDATGRRNSITDRLGDVTTMTYHAASGNLAAVTNADGTTSEFSYTARPFGALTLYDLTMITYTDGTTESLGYDTMGNITSHTDQMGNTATATYNACGQPLTATNVAGATTTNTYNADGTLATTTDPAGNTTTFGYDGLKRLNLVTFADGATRSFTYNDHDQLLTSTDGNGNTTTFTYDGNGNLASITNPLGHTSAYNYDGNDRLLSVTDPLGNTAGITYNELGKIKTITDENGNVTTMGYNTLGRLISTTDASGQVWSTTYDAEAILASTTDPLGNTTTFTSDTMGRIIQTTSPLGNVSSVTYDAMGQIMAVENALGRTTARSYDARGLSSSITLPGGITASYTRNELGLITAISDPAGNNWQRAYDSQGRPTSATDPLGNVVSYQYDNRNRVSQVDLPAGSLNLSCDGVGNIIRRLYSDGTDLNYTYDAMNRLTGAEGITLGYDANGRITSSNGLTVTRDAGGRIATITLAPGKTITYAYDNCNLLAQVADWLGGTTTFTYDAAGRLTAIARPNGVATHYSYDTEDRITGITEGSISSTALTRDGIGKITGAIRNVPLEPTPTASTQDLSYDPASQVSTYTYDGMGRLTNDNTRTYTWDLASRMTSYTEDANTVTFTYDALGFRLSRTKGGTTRSYVWNYALSLPSVSVAREGGDDLRYYIYTPGCRLLYSIEAADNSRRDYHFDETGNTLFLTDSVGAVMGSHAHSPYGEILSSTGGLDNPFTWQGQFGIMDEGNGLYYVRVRYYDSNTSRFISRDPVESIRPESITPYQYAYGSPMMFIDPLGLDPCPSEIDPFCNWEEWLAHGYDRVSCCDREMLPAGRKWDLFYGAYHCVVNENKVDGWNYSRGGNIPVNINQFFGGSWKGLCDEWADSLIANLSSDLPDGWKLSRVTRYRSSWTNWFAAAHRAVALINPDDEIVGVLDPHSSGGGIPGKPNIIPFKEWQRWYAPKLTWMDYTPSAYRPQPLPRPANWPANLSWGGKRGPTAKKPGSKREAVKKN